MRNKKIIAAKILKTSIKKVKFREDSLEEIKKAITRSDLKGLIAVKKITKDKANGHSKSRSREKAAQKRKGRQKGKGSQRGKKNASVSKKDRWMAKIRVQRIFIKELKEKGLLSSKNYRHLYVKSKGGYFRNKRHIKLYLTEQKLIEDKGTKKENEKK